MTPCSFEKNGYEVCRGVISKEIISSIYNFLTAEMNKSIDTLKNVTSDFSSGDLVKDLDYMLSNVQSLNVDDATLSLATGLFPLNVRLSKTLHRVLESKDFVSIIKEKSKSEHLKMHMPPAARFVLPKNKHGMAPAHNDIIYNKYVEDFVVVWVPLTRITAGPNGSGGLIFFENPNTTDVKTIDKKHPYWLPELDTEGLDQNQFELEPGDILIFTKDVIHKSILNNSDMPRISIDYRFFPSSLKSTKHSLDLDTNQIIEPTLEQEMEIYNEQ